MKTEQNRWQGGDKRIAIGNRGSSCRVGYRIDMLDQHPRTQTSLATCHGAATREVTTSAETTLLRMKVERGLGCEYPGVDDTQQRRRDSTMLKAGSAR